MLQENAKAKKPKLLACCKPGLPRPPTFACTATGAAGPPVPATPEAGAGVGWAPELGAHACIGFTLKYAAGAGFAAGAGVGWAPDCACIWITPVNGATGGMAAHAGVGWTPELGGCTRNSIGFARKGED